LKKGDDKTENNLMKCALCQKVEDVSCKNCKKTTICLDKCCSVVNGDQHFGCAEYLMFGCQNCLKQTKTANLCNDCYIRVRDFIINKTH